MGHRSIAVTISTISNLKGITKATACSHTTQISILILIELAYIVLVHDSGMLPATPCSVQTRIELDHYPEFQDDTTFVTELIAEQGVTCMPGSVRG